MRYPPPNGFPYLVDLINHMDRHMLGTFDAIDEVRTDMNGGTRTCTFRRKRENLIRDAAFAMTVKSKCTGRKSIGASQITAICSALGACSRGSGKTGITRRKERNPRPCGSWLPWQKRQRHVYNFWAMDTVFRKVYHYGRLCLQILRPWLRNRQWFRLAWDQHCQSKNHCFPLPGMPVSHCWQQSHFVWALRECLAEEG